MAYAVFKTGGKQDRVEEGDQIDVEKLEAKVGDTITFDEVFLVSDGSATKVGAPTVISPKPSGTRNSQSAWTA